MMPVLAWLEGTGVASAVRNSLALTAWLSAAHMIGVTLVGTGALVTGLRFSRVLFANQPLTDVTRPGGRAILAGVCLCLVTGALLVSPRATAAGGNPFFQGKMLFLAAAVAFDVILRRRGEARAGTPLGLLRSVCYGAVILAACGFILLGE